MGHKAIVCESIEPPGSRTTTRSSAHPFTDTVQELLPLFDHEPFYRRLVGAPSRKASRCASLFTKSDSCDVVRFRNRFFNAVNDAEWNDWKWQFGNRIRSFEQLNRFLPLIPEERAAQQATEIHFPLSITPYYLALFFDKDSCHPLRKSMVPQVFECLTSPAEAIDPLGEESQSPVPGLVHRYPDRVLFLATTTCSCYCRYCTRSRVVGNHAKREIPQIDQWNAGLAYIRSHSEIRDVLISGGDPFMLSDDQLQWLVANVRKIPHVELVRIGTKTPMVLPQRITPQLVRMLKRYHPLYISIHATHPDEITGESTEACGRLADAGIPLGSQTVLLAGVNDSVDTMRELFHGLLRMRVRPYYLYQCDPILGSGHFRTSVRKGIDIIRGLRGHTTGYALPTFVIDAPGGGGKIPVMPDYVTDHANGRLILTNYNNGTFIYPDEKDSPAPCSALLSEGAGI
ncbi:MAG: KamA family radical SAM protein [Chitinispirillaceae bacterium]|nr:KamA family radical SAM protein [Chitinispirillaceae bacterium]